MELTYSAKEAKQSGKKGLPRVMYLPWAGYFPHPELDRDIEKPAWAVSDEVRQVIDAMPPIPPTVKFHIPNGISLAEMRQHSVECKQSALQAVQTYVVRDAMLGAAAADDRKGLARRKPLDGVYAFIWRFARYHSGIDASVPVTAFWDLEDGIARLTGQQGGANEEVVGFLEAKARELVAATGGEQDIPARRWARIMGRMD